MWKYVLPPVVVVATLWMLMSSATTYYLYWVEHSHNRVLDENVAAIQLAHEFQRVLRRLDRALLDENSGRGSPVEWELYLASLEDYQRKLLALSRNAEGTRKALELSAILARLKEELSGLSIPSLLVADLSHVDITTKRVALIRPAIDELSQLNSEVIKINQYLIDQAAQRRLRVGRVINSLRITLLCTGPVVGVWLGWKLSRRLQRSMGRIAVILRQVNGEEIDLGRVTLQADGVLEDVQQQAEAIVGRLRETHRELDTARSEVIRSERLAAVGQLAAGVAHELRNPLTSVKLLLQHAARQHSPAPLSDNKLCLILEEVGRMELIIQGLLDFSRAQPLHRTCHDVASSLRRAIDLIEGRARLQNVELCLQSIEGALIDGDAEQLHQVFVNLLINAIESMPDGGRVDVIMTRTTGKLRIEFHDAGSGIPEAILPRLFEPFATSKERGTGLGLAVSRRIIDQHCGSLVGSNVPAGGALFIIELPVQLENPSQAHDKKPGLVAHNSEASISH